MVANLTLNLVAVVLVFVIFQVSAQGETKLFPFGNSTGDRASSRADDVCDVEYNRNIILFGTNYSSVFVCTNGILSLGSAVPGFIPQAFPLDTGTGIIAAYWADADPRRGSGNVWSRKVTADSSVLDSVSNTVNSVFSTSFQAKWALVTTWDQVQPFNQGNTDGGGPENTFQAVLFSDGDDTYALYLYESITWSLGTASRNTDAQVGFDAGNGQQFFAVEASRTPAIDNIDNKSNIGKPGQWLFRLSDTEIVTPPVNECEEDLDSCNENASCTDLPEGYNCTCNDGFTGDGFNCTLAAVDECEEDLHTCDKNAFCTDLADGFKCTCNNGFIGDGFNCKQRTCSKFGNTYAQVPDSNCTKFTQSSRFVPPKTQNCPPGLQFDLESCVCNFPKNTTCYV